MCFAISQHGIFVYNLTECGEYYDHEFDVVGDGVFFSILRIRFITQPVGFKYDELFIQDTN